MSLRKFEILEMIAKGGMAEVYRAKTVGLEGFAKELCVKKILPHLTEDQNFVTMFINEAKLAATLSYANIVSVHDLCVSADKEYFIVMEYVHGKDLSDMIRAAQLAGKEIPPEIASFIGREVAKGLHYAHTKADTAGAPLNIIHRDISPQNVLCSFMGEVKITDFGIAKAASISNKTAVGILKGKYGYMSPEQARGQPLDHRSDVFNLGIVLYEMLVGERCFAGASDYSTLNLMREAVVTPPSKVNRSVPADLEQIVLTALARDVKNRYQDALEIESALAKYDSEASATDLARFMKELFASPEENPAARSTGVLNLSSVVGPAPVPPPAEAPKPKQSAKDDAPAEAKPAKPKASQPAPPEPEPKSKVDAPVEEESVPAADPDVVKKARKPARLKPAPADDKKQKKAEAAKNRKPVGRKDLKPGLTDLRALKRSGRRVRVAKVAAIVLVAGAAGVVLGRFRAQHQSEESVFRQMELATLDPAKIEAGIAIVVQTQPPGAAVWLDGNRLAQSTPLAVNREASKAKHEIELTLDGHQSVRKTFDVEPGPVTIVSETLRAEPGELRIRTTPSKMPVRVDGKDVGDTPLTVEVASGSRKVEIGGGARALITVDVDVKPGETTRLDRPVPAKGERTTIAIDSAPAAEIHFDGKPIGRRTGDGPFEVEPGVAHRVTLVEPHSKRTRDIQIKLQPGEKKRLFLDLTSG